MNKKGKNRDLFEDNELFNEINEHDVSFPLFFKNKSGSIFTQYLDENKFEQITITKDHESFRGCLLFGFNELLHDLKGDLKLWFYLQFKNNILINSNEYEKIFESLMNGREEFFSGNFNKYIEKPLLKEKLMKLKWKPVDY